MERKNVLTFLGMVLMAMILSFAIANGGFLVIGALIGLPIVFYVVYKVFSDPGFGIVITLFLAFSLNSLGRYVDGPFGLLIDFSLMLTLLASVFTLKKEDYKILKNGIVIFTSAWFLYTFLELVNPEPHSFEAWFFAVRASSLYMLMTIIATFLLFNKEKDMDFFFLIWFIGSLLGALYGIKQYAFGLNSAESIWLNTKGAKTHLIFGEIRFFSFYSDAGQFGAIMGFTFVTAAILAIKIKSLKKRIFLIATAVFCSWGMVISGTRGALFIPLVGFTAYFVMSKNIKVLVLGSIILGSAFFILKFTYIGESNYQIRRMRSAVKPSDDISFQVRLRNQARLAEYLSTRPFGGGIGTVGYWGEKYNPGTFLGSMPPDSWYVLLWAETGIVGLTLYISMLIYMLAMSFFKILKINDIYLRQKMMAIFSGVCGVAVASYGNPIIGQNPTGIYFYLCLVFLYLGPKWDEKDMNTNTVQPINV